MALFSGTVFTDNGEKLANATVTLTSPDLTTKTITTDANGNWSIDVKESIDPKTTTVTVSKGGYDLKSIPNPQPTGEYTPEPPQINPLTGGTLSLTGGFKAGKYLVSSLSEIDKSTLDKELSNLALFIDNNPGNYTVTIVSSESRLTNYDREETSPTNNTPVPQKWLSTKRQDNLEKYILDYLNANGTPAPNIIKSPPLVQGPANGAYPPSSSQYTKWQYIELEARLIRPRCSWVDVTGSLKGDKLLTKPSEYITQITVDAAIAPDRFGLNGFYKDYYSQSPTAPGSLTSWQFIAYIGSILGRGEGAVQFPIDRTLLKNSLLADYDLVPTIKDNIKKYSFDKRIFDKDKEKLIDNVITKAGAFGKKVVREETVFDISRISGNDTFTINAENSLYIGGSAWKYKMCD